MSFPSMRFIKPPSSDDKGIICCELCPHYCKIKPGKSGLCKVRVNSGGSAEIPYYGHVTSLATDPIEKKPLYHFRPGTKILSAGFVGCNLACPFCQNWHISQNIEAPGRYISPTELIQAAKKDKQIAYTYSEPLIHIEYLLDSMNEAKKAGVANVLVTNGCINSKPALEVLELTDAANIDLKCFSKKTYKEILGGDLDTVLGFIKKAIEMDVHVEITTLLVPGLNDKQEELDGIIGFIAELESKGKEIPWHVSAYHPDWKWNTAATPEELVFKTIEKAQSHLKYVYAGNVRARQYYPKQ